MANKGKKGNNQLELIWQGELTVQRVVELKNLLQQALDEAQTVTVRLRDVFEVDIAFLQMLCSGHRTATRLGKELRIDAEGDECFTRTLRLAGFTRHAGCRFDRDCSCLWQQEYERSTPPRPTPLVRS